ncbi:MAG: HAD hydrolase family protein [Deltaproteobacteria bacterium]|nr:HAD hydrolase family protein [Deltaproteobacteria bacterium]
MTDQIRLLILDVDGVLTDGRIIISEKGVETKEFNVKDGLGIKMLMKAGIEVSIVSSRLSKALEHRARELGIGDIHLGVEDKGLLCQKMIHKKGLTRNQVSCIGDDLPDLSMFKQVGFPVAVADAAEEVREAAKYITRNKGGNGAVREVCEMILKARGKWLQTPTV